MSTNEADRDAPMVFNEDEDAPVKRKTRKARKARMPDGERDQLDYAWNEPGAPFRSADY